MSTINIIKNVIREALNEATKINWPTPELNALGKELKSLQFMQKKQQSSDILEFQHGLIKRKINDFSAALVKMNASVTNINGVSQALSAAYEHDSRANSAAWAKTVAQNVVDGKV